MQNGSSQRPREDSLPTSLNKKQNVSKICYGSRDFFFKLFLPSNFLFLIIQISIDAIIGRNLKMEDRKEMLETSSLIALMSHVLVRINNFK